MPKWFIPLAILCGLMCATAPILVAQAPYESTMGLVQKVFYVHLPSAWMFLLAAIVCGIASVRYLFGGDSRQDRLAWAAAELAVLFGVVTLVTGPLWARKAWGVWWQWDARLTMALMAELIFVGYLLVRKYGGPGAEKLAAGMGIFGAATTPFIYKSVDWWRTIHPQTSVVRNLGETAPDMYGAMLFCTVAFLLLFASLLTVRVHLESRRAELDRLYLALEDQP